MIKRHVDIPTESEFASNDIPDNSYYVDFVTAEAYDSPFIHATPFIVKNGNLYAVSAETGSKSGPYCKVGDNGSYYFVYTSDKGGIVSKSGDVIADCIYDRAYNQMGYAVLVKDDKMGFYSPFAGILIDTVFDELKISDDTDEPILVRDANTWGRVDTNGIFYPIIDGRTPNPLRSYL